MPTNDQLIEFLIGCFDGLVGADGRVTFPSVSRVKQFVRACERNAEPAPSGFVMPLKHSLGDTGEAEGTPKA